MDRRRACGPLMSLRGKARGALKSCVMVHCSRFSGGMPEARSAVDRGALLLSINREAVCVSINREASLLSVCVSKMRGSRGTLSINRGVIAQPRIGIGCLILEASAEVGRWKALGEAGRLNALGEERSETDCQRSMLLSSLARLWVSVASLSRMILVNREAAMRTLWGGSMLAWVSCVGARGGACFIDVLGFCERRFWSSLFGF